MKQNEEQINKYMKETKTIYFRTYENDAVIPPFSCTFSYSIGESWPGTVTFL